MNNLSEQEAANAISEEGTSESQELQKIEEIQDLQNTPMIREAIKDLPQDKQDKILTAMSEVVVSQKFSGPLPMASEFRKYEEVLPGAAERILAMSERQANSVINCNDNQSNNESKIIDHEISERIRGGWQGFTIAILTIISASVLAYFGHEKTAIAEIGAIATLVGIFVYRRGSKEN